MLNDEERRELNEMLLEDDGWYDVSDRGTTWRDYHGEKQDSWEKRVGHHTSLVRGFFGEQRQLMRKALWLESVDIPYSIQSDEGRSGLEGKLQLLNNGVSHSARVCIRRKPI